MFYFSLDDPLIGLNSIDQNPIIENKWCAYATTNHGGHLSCFPDLLKGE